MTKTMSSVTHTFTLTHGVTISLGIIKKFTIWLFDALCVCAPNSTLSVQNTRPTVHLVSEPRGWPRSFFNLFVFFRNICNHGSRKGGNSEPLLKIKKVTTLGLHGDFSAVFAQVSLLLLL